MRVRCCCLEGRSASAHAAYDEAEVGDGVKGRTVAPEHGESPRPTATPLPVAGVPAFDPT